MLINPTKFYPTTFTNSLSNYSSFGFLLYAFVFSHLTAMANTSNTT